MKKKRRMEGHKLIIEDENSNELLSLEEVLDGDVLTIFVLGDLISEVVAEFEDELMASLTIGKNIIIDFKGVNFISSAGLKALLSAQQMLDEIKNIQMILRNLNDSTFKTFEETGFDDLFIIEGRGE